MSEDMRLKSDILWEKIKKDHSTTPAWCDYGILAPRIQEYVDALREERDNAMMLLGTSIGNWVQAMEVLREWGYKWPNWINGSKEQAALVERTKAVLAAIENSGATQTKAQSEELSKWVEEDK